jgi:hypothetical protein
MSADVLEKDYKILGMWTRNLLHPDRPGSQPYSRLKSELAKAGAKLDYEENGSNRSTEETARIAPQDQGRSFWSLGEVTLALREDGLWLLTELTEAAAVALHEMMKNMRDTPEQQTVSLAPAPPEMTPRTILESRLKDILVPLDRGPFENARLWTTVDHIHDGANTRARFYQKLGIEIEEPEEKSKKKATG